MEVVAPARRFMVAPFRVTSSAKRRNEQLAPMSV
jgi:hypothetical protein